MRAVELHLQASLGSYANFRAVAVYADSELSITAVSAFMIYIKVRPHHYHRYHYHHHFLAGLLTLTLTLTLTFTRRCTS